MTAPAAALIDDLAREDRLATTGTRWQLLSDAVMGGVSSGTLRRESVRDRPAWRLEGSVRLENNGGFLQMALDWPPAAARWMPAAGAASRLT